MNKLKYLIIRLQKKFKFLLMVKEMDKVGIIGAGSLGTALAQIVAQNVDKVYLYSRRENLAKIINTSGIKGFERL